MKCQSENMPSCHRIQCQPADNSDRERIHCQSHGNSNQTWPAQLDIALLSKLKCKATILIA